MRTRLVLVPGAGTMLSTCARRPRTSHPCRARRPAARAAGCLKQGSSPDARSEGGSTAARTAVCDTLVRARHSLAGCRREPRRAESLGVLGRAVGSGRLTVPGNPRGDPRVGQAWLIVGSRTRRTTPRVRLSSRSGGFRATQRAIRHRDDRRRHRDSRSPAPAPVVWKGSLAENEGRRTRSPANRTCSSG